MQMQLLLTNIKLQLSQRYYNYKSILHAQIVMSTIHRSLVSPATSQSGRVEGAETDS